MVAYELLAGGKPFIGPDYRHQHLEDKPKPISGIPVKLQSLISECLYKSPQARPGPQNLLVRLQEGVWAASKARQQLQQANDLAVQRKAEAARQQSIAQSEAERRIELSDAAAQSLGYILRLLDNEIEENASASNYSPEASSWVRSLNEAELRVDASKLTGLQSDADSLFEVVAYSRITLRITPGWDRYEGRSHSLWYCDAQEAGIFRWYETAFMISLFVPKRGRLDPFALDPGQEAYAAHSPIMTTHQVAWPFMPIDQGEEDKFIERWIGWFADAAQGSLRHPSTMPELDPRGSWRQRG